LKNSVGTASPGSLCRHKIDACGHEELYMQSTLQLINFYKTFGFVPLPEDQLPRMIRERFHLPLRRDGGVQRLPHAEGGGRVNGVESALFANSPIRTGQDCTS
jgi:hypothetical protein